MKVKAIGQISILLILFFLNIALLTTLFNILDNESDLNNLVVISIKSNNVYYDNQSMNLKEFEKYISSKPLGKDTVKIESFDNRDIFLKVINMVIKGNMKVELSTQANLS